MTAPFHGGVVAVKVVLGHRVDAEVGAGQRARDGDTHRGAVGGRDLHLAGLGIDGLDLAEGDVPDQLVAPPSISEDAVGLLDDEVAFEVVVELAGAPLALGDQLGVERLSERLGDGGREPVPEQLVLADDCGVGLVPVAVDPVSSTGQALD